MLVELKAREIELRTQLYEAELFRDYFREAYTEEEKTGKAHYVIQENEAKCTELKGRLWVYLYSGSGVQSDDPERVQRHLEGVLREASSVAVMPVNEKDTARELLDRVDAVFTEREVQYALSVLVKKYSDEFETEE